MQSKLTILQAEHFFTFLFSVQTLQQSLKSALEKKKNLLTFRFKENRIVTSLNDKNNIDKVCTTRASAMSPQQQALFENNRPVQLLMFKGKLKAKISNFSNIFFGKLNISKVKFV